MKLLLRFGIDHNIIIGLAFSFGILLFWPYTVGATQNTKLDRAIKFLESSVDYLFCFNEIQGILQKRNEHNNVSNDSFSWLLLTFKGLKHCIDNQKIEYGNQKNKKILVDAIAQSISDK